MIGNTVEVYFVDGSKGYVAGELRKLDAAGAYVYVSEFPEGKLVFYPMHVIEKIIDRGRPSF